MRDFSQWAREGFSSCASFLQRGWWTATSVVLREPRKGTDGQAVGKAVSERPSWQSKAGALAVVLPLALGQLGSTVLLITGVSKQSAVTTGFVSYTVTTLLLWLWVRPKLRSGWPMWWRAIILGASYSANIIAAREALHHLPLVMITSLFFVLGPVTAAIIRIRSRWLSVFWAAVALFGVVLVLNLLGTGLASVNLLGLACVAVMGANYHVYVTIAERLKRKNEVGGENDDVNTCITLSRVPSLVALFGMLVLIEGGPGAVVELGWEPIWVLCIVGALSALSTLVVNFAWNVGLKGATHALLQPARPALGVLFGLLADQKPKGDWTTTLFGIGLITIAGFGAARAELRERADQPASGNRAERPGTVDQP